MIFDYNAPIKQEPYYSNIENSPEYQQLAKAMRRNRTVGTVFGTLFSAGANLIPGGSALGGLVNNAIGNSLNRGFERDFKELESNWKRSLPPGVNGTSAMPEMGTNSPIDLSKLTKILSGLKLSPEMLTDNIEVGADPTLIQAPMPDGQFINIAPTEGTMDWNMSGLGLKGGGHISVDDDGVKLKYQRGGVVVEGGQGNDDIALVDTTNNKDTGVRVSKGEMLVVSKDNLDALKSALKTKNKSKVFSIMETQIAAKPEVKNGTEGFLYGGPLLPYNVDEGGDAGFERRVNALSDGDLAALLQYRWKMSDSKTRVLDKIIKDRGLKPVFPADRGALSEVYLYKGENRIPQSKGSEKNIQNLLYATANPGEETKATPEVQPMVKTAEIGSTNIPTVTESAFNLPSIDDGGFERSPEEVVVDPLVPTYERPINETPEFQPIGTPRYTPDNYRSESSNPLMGLGSALGYLGGAAQLGFGLNAANQELPAFTKSARWADYLNDLETLAQSGLTANQMAQIQGNNDRTYAYDVANIYNLSGGNAGMALGNLGRAARSKYGNDLNLAALNDQIKRSNMANYGGAVNTDMNWDRLIFGDNYTNALRNKQAGAELASAGLRNILEQSITDREFGMGTPYWKYMNALTKEQEENAEISKNLSNYLKFNVI